MSSHQGHIKYWNSDKGYGFIARENDEDVFVHISQLTPGVQPRVGLQIAFGLKQDHKGRWQAQQVRNLHDDPAPATAPATAVPAAGPLSPLQRLWRMSLLVAALLLASFILVKSITPFYSLNTQQTPASSQLEPGSPYADNAQLQHTLQLILQGGPYPYNQDNSVFHNREKLLPAASTGYYREYTVPTPGARDRAARRVVTGGNPPEVWYYTEDHYRSFVRLDVRS